MTDEPRIHIPWDGTLPKPDELFELSDRLLKSTIASDQPDIVQALAAIVSAGATDPTLQLQVIELFAQVAAVLAARVWHDTGVESMSTISDVLERLRSDHPRPNLRDVVGAADVAEERAVLDAGGTPVDDGIEGPNTL